MHVFNERKSLARLVYGAGAIVSGTLALCAAQPGNAEHGRELAALSTLQSGQWVLRGLDTSSPTKSLCVGNLQSLLRLGHPGANCSEAIISDMTDQAIVYYSCPGVGHAQTTLKVETPRLLHIESQGVRGNEPFAVMYEARRAGECAAATLAHPR